MRAGSLVTDGCNHSPPSLCPGSGAACPPGLRPCLPITLAVGHSSLHWVMRRKGTVPRFPQPRARGCCAAAKLNPSGCPLSFAGTTTRHPSTASSACGKAWPFWQNWLVAPDRQGRTSSACGAWSSGGCQEISASSRGLLFPLYPQGLESSWERHRANCTQLCQGLLDLGLELFVKEEVSAGQAHQYHHHRVGAA